MAIFSPPPLSKHFATISAFPPSSDKAALQRFLGMVNRKVFRGAARVLAPLTDALQGPGKSLSWSPAFDSAFTRAKDLLSFLPKLVHPQPEALISLSLWLLLTLTWEQFYNSSWTFYSKKLSDPEKKYSAFHCELLAANSSLHHFRFMLEGR